MSEEAPVLQSVRQTWPASGAVSAIVFAEVQSSLSTQLEMGAGLSTHTVRVP